MIVHDELTDDERDRFIGLFHESLKAKTHYELFLWLQGRLQKYLPHDTLIVAWGEFANGQIYYDVISALPEVRTGKINNDNLNLFLKRLFKYWESNGCTPLHISMNKHTNLNEKIGYDLAAQNFGNMKSLLVHAIKDFRERHDCLYVMLSKKKSHPLHARTMFEALMPYIDTSLRKLPHLPKQEPKAAQTSNSLDHHKDIILGITPREAEIMMLVRIGKTNIEIGSILDISSFTVKNHLQRIYKKLNVCCRAQAAARF